MRVEVVRGPLQEITGIFLHKVRPFRLVLSIHLITQAASVEIDADDVVPIQSESSAYRSQVPVATI